MSIFFTPVLIFIPVSIFISLILTVFFLRKKIEKRKILISRVSSAFYAVLCSQILFVIVFAVLFVLTSGIIVMGAAELAFANLLVGIFVFLIALITYGPFIARYYVGKLGYPGIVQARVRSEQVVVSVLVILGLLYNLHVASSFAEVLLVGYAVKTNNIELVEIQKYDFQKDITYRQMALNTKETRFCDKMSTSHKKADCYIFTDPEYQKSLEGCTLYTKHGNMEMAYWSQRDCVVDKHIFERLENGTDIQCDVIAKDFEDNPQITRIVNLCESVDAYQEVVKTGDPQNCQVYLAAPSEGYWTDLYMGCIGHFMESPEWHNACSLNSGGLTIIQRPNLPPEYTLMFAKCPGYKSSGFYGDEERDLFVF